MKRDARQLEVDLLPFCFAEIFGQFVSIRVRVLIGMLNVAMIVYSFFVVSPVADAPVLTQQ